MVDQKTPAALLKSLLDQATKQNAPVTQVVTFDAKLATYLMARNVSNRDIGKDAVRKIRNDIEKGMWGLNYQPIIVDKDGNLADGQHRLSAVLDSKLSFESLLVVGVEPEVRITMDQSRPRRAGDYLKMRGEDLGQLEASIVRLLMAYEAGEGGIIKGESRPTAGDVLAYFDKHADEIRASAKKAEKLREPARYHAAPKLIGFLHYLTSKIDPTKADEFIDQIAKGEALKAGDPAYAVRERWLAMGRAGTGKKAAVAFTGWNYQYSDRPLTTIRLPKGKLPTLAGLPADMLPAATEKLL